MSMYGTIYYQVAQGFTKFLLKNFGRNNKTFLLETPGDSEAESGIKTTTFSFESGNQWVELEPKENGVAIWHSKPDSSAEQSTTYQGAQKVSENDAANIQQLALGDIIKVPLLKFDAAGHISQANNEAVYYKMPTIQIDADITDLEDRTTQLEVKANELSNSTDANKTSIEAQQKEIKALQDSFGDIKETNKDGEKDLCTVIGNLTDLQDTYFEEDDKLSICDMVGQTKESLNTLEDQYYKFVEGYTIAYTDLLKRIQALENG